MELYEKCLSLFKERGVAMEEIAECVLYLQKGHGEISMAMAMDAIDNVLRKREVQHAIITGITLDKLAEQNALHDEELQQIMISDYSLYGVDEVLAYGICNIYGSIALTNFGFIDKEKPLIVKKLNDAKHHGECHTFLDDIVGAIAASAASRLAHGEKK